MPVITVKKDEERIVPLLWTGKETELEYRVKLAEPGAKVTFLGLLLGREAQALSLNVEVEHAAPYTTSEVVIKSALSDTAKASITGLVKVDPGAKGTQAWLAAHLLLLSEKAKGVAVPSLEILENEVKAGHATTVGRISEQELFYLMSRGLGEAAARALIVHGFLQEMVDRLPKAIAVRASRVLQEKYEQV
ncbi:MAG TPA: SufD family Fe-S cluster assembly protein [Candidatus Saccharimonadia bacterium]|nr:SufD family Fe-S cluster assembly protein [Candidatus Saccharimonadia bacterium]